MKSTKRKYKVPLILISFIVMVMFLLMACGNNLALIAEFDANANTRTPTSWTEASFSGRTKITFNNTNNIVDTSGGASLLENIPVLLKLNCDKINYTISSNKILRFINPNNSFSELTYEVEKWNTSCINETQIWVKIDKLKVGTNFVYMYYGFDGSLSSPYPISFLEDTWLNSYEIVYHFENSSLTRNSAGADSISSVHIENEDSNSIIGEGINLSQSLTNGKNKFINTNINNSLTKWTMSAWVKSVLPISTLINEENAIISRGKNYSLFWDHNNINFRSSGSFEHSTGASAKLKFNTLLANTWQQLVVSYDGSTLKTYLNGSLQNSLPVNKISDSENQNIFIGKSSCSTTTCFFDGKLDEVRVSSVARSDEWIKLQYKMVTTSFVTYGSKETN